MNLIDAVVKNDIKKVAKLLAEGVDPNFTEDQDNITGLHFAAQNNFVKIAQLLILAGAKIDSRTITQETPLEVALLSGHYEMAELLVRWQNTMSTEMM